MANHARRKLLVTGDYTYMLTLPKEWVKAMGWRAKQALLLKKGTKSITIQDYPNQKRKT